MGKSRLVQPSQFNYGVYGYFSADDISDEGEVTFVYIGVDMHIDTDRRHSEHMKPSKRLIIKHDGKLYEDADELYELSQKVEFTKRNTVQPGQLVNNLIQDKNLQYQVIATFISEELMYSMETEYLNRYKPLYNVKFSGWKEKYEE